MYMSMGMLAWAAIYFAQSASSASSSSVNYFQTEPNDLPGPTTTGSAPFLAETNTIYFGTSSFVPNSPLETAVPIAGNTNNSNIFQLMGQLSSYFPNPSGFGAEEYPLPPGANITQVHVLHRHGSRYPTGTVAAATFGNKIQNLTRNGTIHFNGSLSWLNTWSYNLGAEILVPRGRQEMFDSGVLFYYNYAQLYNPNGPKLIARATTQDRMLKSGEYFLAGFFGLEWTKNASLLPIVESATFITNDTLAGYDNCPNANNFRSTHGTNLTNAWAAKYLANATARIKSTITGNYTWTVSDTYNAQQLCPYETVAYGYSHFCNFFTYEEWKGYEYSIDVNFYGNNMFGSPTGRAVGSGWVAELYARLLQHFPTNTGDSQLNTTLDSMNLTFPLNQTLYFDFSHDTNIAAIVTALGMDQFNQTLTAAGPPPNQQMIVSHMEPFGARLVLEVIKAPGVVLEKRPHNISTATASSYYEPKSKPTTYVHLMMSQRTIPLGKSYPSCGARDDGWCELSTYLKILSTKVAEAKYHESCYGSYPAQNVTNGVPVIF